MLWKRRLRGDEHDDDLRENLSGVRRSRYQQYRCGGGSLSGAADFDTFKRYKTRNELRRPAIWPEGHRDVIFLLPVFTVVTVFPGLLLLQPSTAQRADLPANGALLRLPIADKEPAPVVVTTVIL